MDAEKKVGDRRKFTNDVRMYTIREVLNDPKISMWWTWDSGVCPHCKIKLTRDIQHEFYRIEILGDETKEDALLTIGDVTLMGDTLDNRRMIITLNLYNQILGKSEKFKHLVKGV